MRAFFRSRLVVPVGERQFWCVAELRTEFTGLSLGGKTRITGFQVWGKTAAAGGLQPVWCVPPPAQRFPCRPVSQLGPGWRRESQKGPPFGIRRPPVLARGEDSARNSVTDYGLTPSPAGHARRGGAPIPSCRAPGRRMIPHHAPRGSGLSCVPQANTLKMAEWTRTGRQMGASWVGGSDPGAVPRCVCEHMPARRNFAADCLSVVRGGVTHRIYGPKFRGKNKNYGFPGLGRNRWAGV